jgi:sugar/nucleoside kinase (ribokinase family)
MFDLVGIGNPVYDSIITPRSKTPGRVLSGCSTNACLAAKKLGLSKVGLVGCVGRDYEARFKQDMNKFGIEVNVDPTSGGTGGFHLVYDEKGDRTLDVLGIAGKITSASIPEGFLRSRVIMIGPILGEVNLDLIKFLRSSTSSKLFLDPQGLLRSIGSDGRIIHNCDREEFSRIAANVDFVKPNESECQTITGEADPVVGIRRLKDLGVKVPIVTLAHRGSLLLEGNTLHKIPAYATKAIDPTGAGDVYAGSFITNFERGGSLLGSSIYASAAASIMVEQVGPEFSLRESDVLKRAGSIRDGVVTESPVQ